MAVIRFPVLDDFLGNSGMCSSLPGTPQFVNLPCLKDCRKTHNIGWSFSHRTTFEAFQLATYFPCKNRLRSITLVGQPVDENVF